ncbi:MAG: type II secretion system protein GspG [Candidatus Sumerlaeaceae bacterium]|nr:type II secretion system protein GspG [Candidatus Sumerlaeaceae bacterium]
MKMIGTAAFSPGGSFRGRPAARRGFTAIEIAMVATVIAIFALLVLPLFRNRVEEAKIAAARADLTSLMKAEQLVKADTGYFVRLEDLDNIELNLPGQPNPTPPPNGITLEVPPFYYLEAPPSSRAPLTVPEWIAFAGTTSKPKFRGPYIAFQNSLRYGDLLTRPENQQLANNLLRSRTGNPASAIFDIPTGPLFDSLENRIPVDPWGNPYLFFPATGETGFASSVIYSLGPDGLPGLLNGTSPNDFLRGTPNGLGTLDPNVDDLQVQF